MTYGPLQLQQIKERLNNDNEPVVTTPRELIGWFGQYRRTWRQVKRVRQGLRLLELETIPDFEGAGFDETVHIRKVVGSAVIANNPTTTTTPDPCNSTTTEIKSGDDPQTVVDPIHRVSRFLTPYPLVTVTRDEATTVAITKMMMNDYSQLPVMQGESKVSGMISWRSIGKRRALGAKCEFSRECLEPHYEVRAEDSIFDAIRVIQEHDCVLVRSKENKITGILTATDISGSFEQLSRPFLLLGYIENHLRALISPKLNKEDLQAAKDPTDIKRSINDVSDLTFGEYVRLLERPANWTKLNIGIERSLFVSQLNDVREIRNDVMHFNPEGIEDKDLTTLRKFSDFLESIVSHMP